MNKGFSLTEALTAIFILSIVLVIMTGFVQTGHSIFSKGYKDFIIKNEYNDLVTILSKDFKNLKQIKKADNNELKLITQNDILITYKIIKDNKELKILRQDKEIEFKNIAFEKISFEAYNKTCNKTFLPRDIILIKMHITYLDNKKVKHHSFELFEIDHN